MIMKNLYINMAFIFVLLLITASCSDKDDSAPRVIPTMNLTVSEIADNTALITSEQQTGTTFGDESPTNVRHEPAVAGSLPLSDEISSSCVQLVIMRIIAPIANNLFFIPFILLSYTILYHSFSSRSPAEPPSLHAPSVPEAFQVWKAEHTARPSAL